MLAAARSSLTSLKDSLSDVRMDRPPEAIIARARGRRLRRGLPAAIGAGGLALGIAMALSLSGGPTSGGPPAARAVHVNLAAWSVNTTSAGRVDVTIRQLKDPARLSHTLAEAGVPVKLTSGTVCTGSDSDLELAQVVRKLPSPRGDVVLRIDPSAMPAGKELVIGIGHLRMGSSHGRAAAFGLIKKGSSMDCSTAQS
ncbi:MAG: hypothetical protein LBV34_13530 [Nocardiopsaceae bacterium]|nr:hypothetical protein [Nocardiopsaceae bacterium]